MEGDLGLKAGDSIQDYKLVVFLNSGSTADIWKVTDLAGRDKALKIFSPVKSNQEVTMDVLLEEFKLTIPLDHPSILKPENIGVYKGVPFLVMPYCEGSLADEMNQRQFLRQQNASTENLFNEAECAKMLTEVGQGLGYLHEHAVIHQDIKPENILLLSTTDAIRYVIADFGTSRRKSTVNTEGRPEIILLTPAYAAPEQLEGQPEKASDIYSLGAMAFEMIEGSVPVQNEPSHKDWQNSSHTPPRMKAMVSPQLRNLIMRCLASVPGFRPEVTEIISTAKFILENKPEPEEDTIAKERQERKTELFTPSYKPQEEQQQLNNEDIIVPLQPYTQTISNYRKAEPTPNFNLYSDRKRKSKVLPFSLFGIAIIALGFFGYNKVSKQNALVSNEQALTFFYKGNLESALQGWEKAGDRVPRADEYAKVCVTLMDQLDEKSLDGIRPFSHDRAAIKLKDNDLWGFIDQNGHIIVPMLYTEVFDFHPDSDYTAACRASDQLCGFLDRRGGEHHFEYVHCKYIDGKIWEAEKKSNQKRITEKINPANK